MANQKTIHCSYGKEYPELNELYWIDWSIRMFEKSLKRRYKDKKYMRTFHPKVHGCVKAEFIIEPGLSSEYYRGIFQEGKVNPALARFSNAKPKVNADDKKTGRGLSIKLVEVESEKMLEEKKDAQT